MSGHTTKLMADHTSMGRLTGCGKLCILIWTPVALDRLTVDDEKKSFVNELIFIFSLKTNYYFQKYIEFHKHMTKTHIFSDDQLLKYRLFLIY